METADVRGLLGLLLADGHFTTYRAPAGGYVQLTLTAGANESAFLEEKAEEFKRFCPTRARITPYSTPPRANGLCCHVLRFRVSTNRLRPIYNMLYPQGERCITQMVLDMLGARAAAWLWAEGARPNRDGSARLARVGVTHEEAQAVSRWLSMLTGAQPEFDDSRVRPCLLFAPGEARQIRDALRSYAPASRLHLFSEEIVDRIQLRSYRTRLLPGEGADPDGQGREVDDRDPEAGERVLLLGASGAAAQ
jgi:hypothetical protein